MINKAKETSRRAHGGMTLVEVMVSLSVITLCVLTTVTVMHTTANHMMFEQVVADQQVQARAAMDEMMEDLRKMSGNSAKVADFDTSGPGTKSNTVTGANVPDSVTFVIPYFDDATKTVLNGATQITYRWAINHRETAGNLIDDDGNGLADDEDGRIERWENGAFLKIVCDNVPRASFLVIKSGRRLQIRVGRKNNTPLTTADGTKIETVVTHNTYCLRNY